MKKDWYSGAIIWKVEDGVLKFLVFWSWSTNRRYMKQGALLKFPGGKNRDHPEDLTPIDTLFREIPEELSEKGRPRLVIRPGANPVLVRVRSVSSDRGPQHEHYKYFYLLHESDLVGDIRTGYATDGNSEMGPPMWLPAMGIQPYGHHRKAARKAVKMLMGTPLFLALTA